MTDDEGLKRPIGTVGPEEQLTPPTSESEAEAECEYTSFYSHGASEQQPLKALRAPGGPTPRYKMLYYSPVARSPQQKKRKEKGGEGGYKYIGICAQLARQ
jgi:hypothetical protein